MRSDWAAIAREPGEQMSPTPAIRRRMKQTPETLFMARSVQLGTAARKRNLASCLTCLTTVSGGRWAAFAEDDANARDLRLIHLDRLNNLEGDRRQGADGSPRGIS